MARPPTIKDDDILRAAREVFLEQGIRATTAQVARRAGIAEGSIFYRFKTKADLFQAAMRPHVEDPPFLAKLPARVGNGDLRESLVETGLEILEFLRGIFPLIMMSWSNPGPSGLPALLDVPNPPPLRVLKRVAGYFEAEMRAGRLARREPEVAARMFLGSLANYVLFEILFRAQEELPLPPGTFVRSLVEILLGGLAPATPAKPPGISE
jgi:AcrR family transcriptional regulator